jgi:hypothetical protein
VSAFTRGYSVGVPARAKPRRQDQLSHRVHQGAVGQGTGVDLQSLVLTLASMIATLGLLAQL